MFKQFQQRPEENDPVLDAIKSIKVYFIYALLFSASINLLMLTPIIYMLQVYDRVISSGSMSTLGMLTLLMVCLLAASGSFDWVRSRILIAANHRLEQRLRDSVSRAAFKHTLNTGNTTESNQVMGDLIGLRQFMTGNGVFAFMDAPWVPMYIWVMFLFHPYFGILPYLPPYHDLFAVCLKNYWMAVGRGKLVSAQAKYVGNNLRNAEDRRHGDGGNCEIRYSLLLMRQFKTSNCQQLPGQFPPKIFP